MAKSLLFPTAEDLSRADHERLAEAYEAACDELMAHHGYSADQLVSVIEPMTIALLALYRAGQADADALARYAASRAIAAAIRH